MLHPEGFQFYRTDHLSCLSEVVLACNISVFEILALVLSTFWRTDFLIKSKQVRPVVLISPSKLWPWTAATTVMIRQQLPFPPQVQQLVWHSGCSKNTLHLPSKVSWREQRTKGKEKTYFADFHQLGEHDDTKAVLLPNHPPEIIDHLLIGPCKEEEECKIGTGGGVGEKKVEDEDGEMSRKSDKITAITIRIEALCNLCQAVE